MEISFRFERHEVERSNQFAIWFQNQVGEVVRTLFVTQYTADVGYRIDLDCLPKWVNRAEPENPSSKGSGCLYRGYSFDQQIGI